MKKIFIICWLLAGLVAKVCAQTMHTVIFANKEEEGREFDRTAEYNNMATFCSEIASSIGYRHDLRRHSGAEFTSVMAEKEAQSLNVNKDDIVLFYYDGHGCNWDDDEWPHMAFLDKQYGETMLYDKLTAACTNAKLVILIAGCCNMDSEGQRAGGRNRQYSVMDANKLKTLFTGFDKRLRIKCSASRRGQYSYSIPSGPYAGNVYAISLRDAIIEYASPQSDEQPTWDKVMSLATEYSYKITSGDGFEAGPQQPQYEMEALESLSTPSTPKSTPVPPPTPVSSNVPEAKISRLSCSLMKLNDGSYLAAAVDFETHFMNESGGKIVAFASNREVKSLEFGTHYMHNTYKRKMVLIGINDILKAAEGDNVQLKVGIYDYKQNKFIAYSNIVNINLR